MGALPYSPVRHTGSSKFQEKDKEKVTPLWGMGASSSALNAAAIGSLSRASSAKFAMSNAGSNNTSQKITSTKGAVSTSLFKNEDEGEEKDEIPSSSRSIKDLRSMFSGSRQPSYRETATLENGSGKDALRAMMNKPSSVTVQDIPSASSTRQNSGGAYSCCYSFIFSTFLIYFSFVQHYRCGSYQRSGAQRSSATFPQPRRFPCI